MSAPEPRSILSARAGTITSDLGLDELEAVEEKQ
jgi:hypothetical protein